MVQAQQLQKAYELLLKVIRSEAPPISDVAAVSSALVGNDDKLITTIARVAHATAQGFSDPGIALPHLASSLELAIRAQKEEVSKTAVAAVILELESLLATPSNFVSATQLSGR